MVAKAKYRESLPQRDGTLFLTDGSIETTLIFEDGFELPHFAAFDLLRDAKGRAALTRYYERRHCVGEPGVAAAMHDLRARHETAASPMVVSGCVGPRGDGYDPGQVMSALVAEDFTGNRSAPSPTPRPTW